MHPACNRAAARKVPLSDDWLVYKNYVDFQVAPSKATFRNSLCTPYMYTKYACIFGLTGSVGGEAERAYIEKTYQAVPYEVAVVSSEWRVVSSRRRPTRPCRTRWP